MKELPKAFLSTLLAQKKLLGNGGSENNMLADSYNFNSNIKELPTFTTPIVNERTDYGLPISEIMASFTRKAKTVYERALISEYGKELITKACEYEIPYDTDNIDFLTLKDEVEEFEYVVEQANRFGIDWKSFGYDILGIEQALSEDLEVERSYADDVRSQFFGTRGVEA
jgi:hypothetical protein